MHLYTPIMCPYPPNFKFLEITMSQVYINSCDELTMEQP